MARVSGAAPSILKKFLVPSDWCVVSKALLSSLKPQRRRVVVTGIGLVTCLGTGIHHVWNRLLAGESGIRSLPGKKDYDGIPCQIAGMVPQGTSTGQLDFDQHIKPSYRKNLSLASCYALVAAQEALLNAKWAPNSELDRCKTGVAIGTGMAGLDDIIATGHALSEYGYRRVSPHFIPKVLTNMPAGEVSIYFGLKGPSCAPSTACASGLQAIGDAARLIESADVDVMVCGGTEACVCPVALAGFARMRALAVHFNNDPQAASRPFDIGREGFVMSDGAGVLVIEELEHARSRNAPILAELLGYGLSADANHITAPSSDGNGAYRCMSAALQNACLQPAEIGYINAHASSTPLGDAAEVQAIKKLFSSCLHQLAVSSTKGAVGHLLGAAGAVEAAFTVLACSEGILPPTLNCCQPDSEFGEINFVPLTSQLWPDSTSGSRIALTNSFGFGGTNATVCISSYKDF